MAQVPLPKEWLMAVCDILESEDTRFIEWTLDARNRFEANFYNSWTVETYRYFKGYLRSSKSTGCPVHMSTPVGETYEFFFDFKSKKTYGKILLRNCRKKIIVFSAHAPLREKLYCD
jgi:hypothetical protein